MTARLTSEEGARLQRIEAAYRRLGTRNPACRIAGCAESDPRALVGSYPDITCYEHDRLAQGLAVVEADHRAGRANDPFTVDVPGNDHRVLSDYQYLWPMETLRNREGSPLLRIAAVIRGWLDVLRLILERLMGWIPGALERLDVLLAERIGVGWWLTIGWVTP